MILNFNRDEVVALYRLPGLNGGLFYDVCKALSEGNTQAEVVKKFDLNDDREVRRIKSRYCPQCGNHK